MSMLFTVALADFETCSVARRAVVVHGIAATLAHAAFRVRSRSLEGTTSHSLSQATLVLLAPVVTSRTPEEVMRYAAHRQDSPVHALDEDLAARHIAHWVAISAELRLNEVKYYPDLFAEVKEAMTPEGMMWFNAELVKRAAEPCGPLTLTDIELAFFGTE